MKTPLSVLLWLCSLWIYPAELARAAGHLTGSVRIACVGNSITFGAGMVNRELNSYPAQLQAILGHGYEVSNFGKNGATLSHRGDIPYIQQPEFSHALEYLPNIVFIELGTNDSKPQNCVDSASFRQDCLNLIKDFRSLPTEPRVVLLLPPPCFSPDTTGIRDTYIREHVIPRLRDAAYEAGVEIVNLYNYFLDGAKWFPDQVHPSSIGAGLIASRLYDLVKLEEGDPPKIAGLIGHTAVMSNYHGFECVDFSFDGRNAKIVRPKRTAKGAPWIWRARFWGHEPQTEIALLERGFHVAYCDVAELFGNNETMTIWNLFYESLTRSGLSSRPALEGFSRGGIYIYRWAAANPTRVACVYADAPVLDFKSWPGGKGRGHGNPEEWERFKRDFDLESEREAVLFKGNPIDLAPEIARAGFSMLHVCGDSDRTVPIEENTDIFEKKILEAGGRIEVIRKPGIGHHPHSLPNPQLIVDFVLQATGHKTNFAVVPVPGNEYREGAGWGEGLDWHGVFNETNRYCDSVGGADIIFLGNSITQGIGGKGRPLAYAPGDSAFSYWFGKYRWLNLGVSGDRTQNVLWRVTHGTWAKLHPKLIILAIGINNFPSDTGEEVVEGIKAIVAELRGRAPKSRILLAGPLPAKEVDSPFRRKFQEVYRRLVADGEMVFTSTVPLMMLRPDGSLDPSVFAADGIHLTRDGYARWARLLAEEISRLRLLD
jgi:lysophospholipase L1-like esterase/pimeloyl-ACP methyl ester carboxylesterase